MPKIVPRRTMMKVFDRIPLYDPSNPRPTHYELNSRI